MLLIQDHYGEGVFLGGQHIGQMHSAVQFSATTEFLVSHSVMCTIDVKMFLTFFIFLIKKHVI